MISLNAIAGILDYNAMIGAMIDTATELNLID